MGALIFLHDHRKKRKQLYLKKHYDLIHNFFQNFRDHNIQTSYLLIHEYYIAQRSMENNSTWDYVELRELLKSAIRDVYGKQLWEELNKYRWFDPGMIFYEEVIERFTSDFITASIASANNL